jgi:hypothetical protein
VHYTLYGGLTQKELAGIIRSAVRPMRITFVRQPLAVYDPAEVERMRLAALTPEAIAAREEQTRCIEYTVLGRSRRGA